MTKKNSKIKEFNKQIFRDYKKSIKHAVFDETLTLYILRPIAFVFVKLLYPTSITPNQVSLMTIIVGTISGYFFSRGTVTSFVIGGSLYFLCMVSDCVDGMIARLKNSGTAVGRIIDGFADYIVAISVYVGMAIGFEKGVINLGRKEKIYCRIEQDQTSTRQIAGESTDSFLSGVFSSSSFSFR